ncbi:MAG: GGDEF domain-containing protein [Armatimonadetes bacterium]|nr:GGDEF domain-containing protein [Armatimonadota bacterium]
MAMQNEERDPMTGLWKGKWVVERLENILGHNGQIALLLIDIDRFKAFNDQQGHERGDEKIVEIAREIESLSGKSSLVFRLGGDEFGVILYEASLQKAREIAETIRAHRKPESLTTHDEKEIAALTLSIGIAHCPDHAQNAQNLVQAADLALLKAKDGGRLPDGTNYIGRNHVMAIGDFWDEFPDQSARFLRHEFTGN